MVVATCAAAACTAAPAPHPPTTHPPAAHSPNLSPSADSVILSSAEVRPRAVLRVKGTTQPGVAGSACWMQRPGVEGCFDTSGQERFPVTFLTVPGGTRLSIDGDVQSASARLWIQATDSASHLPTLEPARGLSVAARTISIDADAGTYTLEVDGSWDRGNVPFYFGIRVP